MRFFTPLLLPLFYFLSLVLAYGTDASAKWSLTEPLRLIQTNLREIDIIDFDVEQYVEDVESHGANTVLINVGGIVANYPSKLDFEYVNPHLKSDVIGEVIEQLHARNIRVIGRFDFSKINEEIASKHPDWLYVSVKGEHVNYNGQVHACVNGDYRQKRKFDILGEVIDSYDLDGIFFNMSGYQTSDYSHHYHGICQSDACRERFKKWSGGLDLPTKEDREDPVFLKYDEFRNVTKNEMFGAVRDFIREKAPEVSICTYVDEGVDLRRLESGSQIHRGHEWEFQSTDNVRRVLGSFSDKQVANAAVHFVSFGFRHASVSPNLTEKRLVQDMFHGGGLDFYCIGRLDNQEDRASLDKVSQVFNFHKQYDHYFRNLESPAKILIVSTNDWEAREGSKGFIRLLSENHLQFDIMLKSQLFADHTPKSIAEYDLLILPDTTDFSSETCAKLDAYVENGGTILATGYTSTRDEIGIPQHRIRLKSLGVKPDYQVIEKSKGTYFKIREQDKLLISSQDLSQIELLFLYDDYIECVPESDAISMLGLITDTMFGPPEKCYYTEVTDKPGLISNAYGKGKSVYFPWRIGKHYNDRSHHGHAAMILGAIHDLLDFEPMIETEVSPLVEVSRQVGKDGQFEWMGVLNHSGQLNTAFHDPIPMTDLGFKLKALGDGKVKSVKLLMADQLLEFHQVDGWVSFTVPNIDAYEMVVLEY